MATIVGELLTDERLDTSALAQVRKLYPSAIAQRVGYLVDFMAEEAGVRFDTDELNEALGDVRYRELSPSAGDGERNRRWHIINNTEIEHDL